MLLCIIGIRWIPSPGGAWCNAPTGIEFAAMKPSERKIEGERIAELLHRCRVARQALLSEGQLTPGFALLARWQSRRLAWTHRDLKASRRFGPAVDFFLGDLYGDRDYTPRDEGMERVAGVMVRAKLDPEHWLNAGIGDSTYALVRGRDIYTPLTLDDGRNPAVMPSADELLASGYVWEDNRKQMAFKPLTMVQSHGRGLVVGFVADPNFRAYVDGLNTMFLNAVFRGPARARPQVLRRR